MLAFQNTTHTKESAVALAKLHRTQDDYIRGTYGKKTKDGGWKGCSVGCMAKGNHKDYPELFGIDARIAYLSDEFFEKIEAYKDWTVDLFESVKDGSDTTIAYYKFMRWMIMDEEYGLVKISKHQSIVDVGYLYLRASKGEVITAKEWRQAANAANAAANAAYATAYAANAANAAAYAAYAANAANAAANAANAANAAANAAYAAYAANAAYAAYAAYADMRKKHYEIMTKKLCWFLAGN
jgi:hypothetical protein